MRHFTALFTLLFAATPAVAAETAWQELTPGVRLRLISSDVRAPDGTTRLGLELDMPEGFKTYWRVPGESGIPTSVDWTGSSGVSGATIAWPYPRIEQTDGVTDFVYRGATVLPVTVTVTGEQPTVAASVTMGICSDVCVPAMASFALPLDFTRPGRADGLKITQAEALAPIAWTGSDPVASVVFDSKANALAVKLADAGIDPASLIAEGGGPGQLFGAPQKSPEPNLVLLPLLGAPATGDLAGMPIELTFMTPDGAFSVNKRIGSGSTAPGG